MNRRDWEQQVFASDLSPTARLLALAVGSFGNWTDDRTVWPSTKALAEMAGIHRDTAQKYMDAFVEQGWLAVVRVRPGNIKEYELCEPVASASGILAKGARANNLPKPQATDTEDQMPTAQASSCLSDTEQLPNGVGADAWAPGTNIKEPTNRNLEELLVRAEPEEVHPSPPSPNLQSNGTLPNLQKKKRKTIDELNEEMWAQSFAELEHERRTAV